jgi:hypothetical protein
VEASGGVILWRRSNVQTEPRCHADFNSNKVAERPAISVMELDRVKVLLLKAVRRLGSVSRNNPGQYSLREEPQRQ